MRTGWLGGIAFLLTSARAAAQATPTMDPAFELVASGQSLAAALFLVAGVRIARSSRRR